MKKYRIMITDSENKKIEDWKSYHVDTAKEAAKLIKNAKRGDLDQIEVDEFGPLTNEYRRRVRITPEQVIFVNGVAIARDIKDAALS